MGSFLLGHPLETSAKGRTGARFATGADLRECRRIHRRHGATYYFATRLFPRSVRDRVHALYAFVRVPDDWVDVPGDQSREEVRGALRRWRAQLIQGVEGVRPEHPAMRAFCDVLILTGIPLEEPLMFLDAMETDLVKDRYRTYGELRQYMRGSACAVGSMMCRVLGASRDGAAVQAAHALGEAMQLTNFLRDVGEDATRGRIYLPLEDLGRYGVSEAEIVGGVPSDRFADLMRYEIDRTRSLYARADEGIALLPPECRKAVRLARTLYARILDKIEENGYDVFQLRARTTKTEKLAGAMRVLCSR